MNASARKSAISLAAFAMVGSTLFGGAALAGDHGDGNGYEHGNTENTENTGGPGGNADSRCLVPIGISVGIFAPGGDVSQCNANGGAGGAGDTDADY